VKTVNLFDFIKGRKADPIGTIRNDRKKMPDGTWREVMTSKTDSKGNNIGDGSYHAQFQVEKFEKYPQIESSVSRSESTESVYVTYKNTENDKRITVRFSNHENNAVKFGDQLNGYTASNNEILYHLGLKKRTFIPKTKLYIWTQQVSKKKLEAGEYEIADKTIQELYDFGKNADLSKYKGKVAKDSNYLILDNKVNEIEEQRQGPFGDPVTIGHYEYQDIDKIEKSNTITIFDWIEKGKKISSNPNNYLDPTIHRWKKKITIPFDTAIDQIFAGERGELQQQHFTVASTPKFMQELGITGDRFTMSYGVISRHINKDSDHTLTPEIWKQLPKAIQTPFAITSYKDGKTDGYRLYTTIQVNNGFVVVGVDVKKEGRDLDVNSISTVFNKEGAITEKERVIYESKEITPQQKSVLKSPNRLSYPSEEKLLNDKDTTSLSNMQQNIEKSERMNIFQFLKSKTNKREECIIKGVSYYQIDNGWIPNYVNSTGLLLVSNDILEKGRRCA